METVARSIGADGTRLRRDIDYFRMFIARAARFFVFGYRGPVPFGIGPRIVRYGRKGRLVRSIGGAGILLFGNIDYVGSSQRDWVRFRFTASAFTRAVRSRPNHRIMWTQRNDGAGRWGAWNFPSGNTH